MRTDPIAVRLRVDVILDNVAILVESVETVMNYSRHRDRAPWLAREATLQNQTCSLPTEALLLCPDGLYRRHVRIVMQQCGHSVNEINDWVSVGCSSTAKFAVVVCRELTPSDLVALRRLESPGTIPCILVTSAQPHNLVRLAHVRVAAVVPLEELEDELPNAARRMFNMDARAQAASAFESCVSLAPAIRRAGVAVCSSAMVVRSVRLLAVQLNVTPDGLCKAWRSTTLYQRDIQLHDFVTASAIWRVALVRSSVPSWTHATRLLGVPTEWLGDSVRRTFHVQLRVVTASQIDDYWWGAILRPLTR